MKFTNGFWLVKKEFRPLYVRDLYEAQQDGDRLVCLMPYQKIGGRADTLNIGMMTVTVSAPMENVIKVRMENHLGGCGKKPEFGVKEPGARAKITRTGDEITFANGALALHLAQGSPKWSFTAAGRTLTGTSEKMTSVMQKDTGESYLVSGLGLEVGEQIYGFGERFTPYVKNGQTIDCWNADGGTASEKSYKNIPFYMTNRGYGVFVNHPGKVSFEVGSEKVETVQFSVQDEELEYYFIYGPTAKDILQRYTALTGRAPVPPKWSFGLWLTTSFTTNYDEATVNSFIDGMAQRDIPLHVFHFDCFWMKGFQWCDFTWDKEMFPDPEGMLHRLHEKGLKICVWINSYIAQRSPLFREAMERGYLLKNADGTVWQWDLWQAGMGIVDFTNPEAWVWYQSKLKALLDMGVDCFKTDFGERIPTENIRWYDGSDPQRMHNYYTFLYNQCVYDLLKKEKGADQAVLFARSATAGGQQFPVHWGGDSTSQYISMAETLRGGLSLADSGFAFWSHDIGGFEDNGSADVYKRWVAFGLLSSHSRLHGSTSYRVPWNYDDEACDVLRHFVKLKCRLMPYLYAKAVEAHETGAPVLRPMHLEFPDDPACEYLDRQYMLGDALLVAPVFRADGWCRFYLPAGRWTQLLTGETAEGGCWMEKQYDFFSLPLYVRENAILPLGACDTVPDYDYANGTEFRIYGVPEQAQCAVYNDPETKAITVTVKNGKVSLSGGNDCHIAYAPFAPWKAL